MKDYTDESDGNEHRNSQVCNTGVKLNVPTLIQNTSSVLMSQITYELKVFKIYLIADTASVQCTSEAFLYTSYLVTPLTKFTISTICRKLSINIFALKKLSAFIK
jgi:hypothetical protein